MVFSNQDARRWAGTCFFPHGAPVVGRALSGHLVFSTRGARRWAGTERALSFSHTGRPSVGGHMFFSTRGARRAAPRRLSRPRTASHPRNLWEYDKLTTKRHDAKKLEHEFSGVGTRIWRVRPTSCTLRVRFSDCARTCWGTHVCIYHPDIMSTTSREQMEQAKLV